MRLTISKAAKAVGVHVETIRYYERRGLIERPRRPQSGGYRLYPEETVWRIRLIKRAQQLGFSLHEIADLLSLRADPQADCSDVRERAVAKLSLVDERLAELRRLRGALESVIAACPGSGAVESCSILEAFEKPPKPRRNGRAKEVRPNRGGSLVRERRA